MLLHEDERGMHKYIDEWGMVAQGAPHRDGGDSCHRMGMYYFGLEIRKKLGISNKTWPRNNSKFYELALGKLQNGKGDLRRHPDQSVWYSDWDRASRDQTIPFMCACSAIGLKDNAWDYVKSHAKRLFLFTTNTKPNWVYPEGDARHVEFDWTPWKRFKFFFGWRPRNERGDKESVYGTKLPDLTILEFWGMEIRALRLWFLWPAF